MKILQQRLSYAEKIADDYKWAKEQINSLADYSFGGNDTYYSSGIKSRYETILRSYRLYNNQIEQSDFDYEFNPWGINAGQKKDEIMPYNKAHNKINVLIGEMSAQPFTYRAYMVSSDGAKATLDLKKELLDEFVKAELQKQLALQQAQQDPNMTDEMYQNITNQLAEKYRDVMTPEQIEEYIQKKYLEPREKKANKVLDRLMFEQRIIEKKKDSFKHGLLSDEEHEWIGIVNGQLVLKVLNPLGVFYEKSPDIKYVQKGVAAGYRTRVLLGDIFDTYRNLKKKDLKKLEDRNIVSDGSPSREMTYNYPHTTLNALRSNGSYVEGQYGFSTGMEEDVVHVEWRSQRKVGFLTYTDENGEEQETIVDETFKIKDPSMKIEWEWVPEIWEGTRIGEDIFTDIGPVPGQEIDLDNPYEQDLRYHGTIYNNTNTVPVSVMERMRPFQMLYLIVMHKWKKLISREKGNKIPIDTSMLPGDMDMQTFLYYFEELDYYFYNSLENSDDPRTANRGAVDKVMMTSKTSEIINYIQILDYIDNQIGEIAGITPSREGQSSPYTPVTNNQQSIISSSNITRLLFDAHQKHWENVINKAVNLAIKSEGGIFQSYDGETRNVFQFTKEEMDNCKFNVYFTDSAKENQIFNDIKGLLQAALQNDKVKFSGVIKALKSSSVDEIYEVIEQAEEIQTQMEQRNQEITLEQTKMQIDAQKEETQLERDLKERNNVRDNETDLLIAEMTAIAIDKGEDSDGDGQPDLVELFSLEQKAKEMSEKLAIERKKLDETAKARKDAATEAEKQRRFERKENEEDRKVERKKIIASKNKSK